MGNALLEGREITATGTSDTATEIGGYAIVQLKTLMAPRPCSTATRIS
jgi:hypothetical protein